MTDPLPHSDRTRKAEIILLGRGLAAGVLAHRLAGQQRVAWLVERPGLLTGHQIVTAPSPATEAQLTAWEEASLPGVSHTAHGWQLDLDQLLPTLAAQVEKHDRCWAPIGTWVRGISVIEQAVLGAIAEDSRYDGRTIVNAAQGERHAAFARMLRHPESFRTDRSPAPRNSHAPQVEGAYQLPDTQEASLALEAALALLAHLT